MNIILDLDNTLISNGNGFKIGKVKNLLEEKKLNSKKKINLKNITY